MNVRTIHRVFCRELRDQLRDRRTLFTVLILPILVYPLLGMAMMQIAQFSATAQCRIWLIGSEHLPHDHPLVERGFFSPGLLDEPTRMLTVVELASREDMVAGDSPTGYPGFPAVRYSQPLTHEDSEAIRQQLLLRQVDAAILIPARAEPPGNDANPMPQILIVHDSTHSGSVEASQRAHWALQKWTQDLIAHNLGQLHLGISDLKPFAVGTTDLADPTAVTALRWSKALPLIIVIWALTGAFYPAVDLCAGEKERGTLETLLSSPAPRRDIIGGKLLTVMTFSMATAILNLVSLGITAGLLVGTSAGGSTLGRQLGISLPPLQIIPALLIALIPIAALFSALAFALASFARSSKEGQYYLMPLLMLTFPLLVLPMLPGTTLNLGTSLIPVSGIILLLHAIIDGNYDVALHFFGPVCAMTLVCCGLALRWSAWQFNDESILFRAADRVGPKVWLKVLIRRRDFGPTVAPAIYCGLAIWIGRLFSAIAVTPPASWNGFWRQTIGILAIVILIPALGFAWATSRKWWETLGLRTPQPWTLATAGLMAVFLHPAFTFLTDFVFHVFPLQGSVLNAGALMTQLIGGAPGIWAIVLILAVAPAIVEELAFRGYILAGFRSRLKPIPAVLATSILFALAHGVFQQSIITFFVGIPLGFWAVRTGSILPCVVFHSVHNALSLFLAHCDPATVQASGWLQAIFRLSDGSVVGYQPTTAIACALVALLLASIASRQSVDDVLVDWSRLSRRRSSART